MHEPGHHPPLGRHVAADTVDLDPCECRAFFQEPSAVATASRWAPITTSATGSVPSAQSTETALGVEKVRSNAFTVRSRNPTNNGVPVVGSFPSTNARSASASTSPDTFSDGDQRPVHTPGASPTPV